MVAALLGVYPMLSGTSGRDSQLNAAEAFHITMEIVIEVLQVIGAVAMIPIRWPSPVDGLLWSMG